MDEQSLDITKTLDKLIDLLKSSDPYKIILFGCIPGGIQAQPNGLQTKCP